MTDYHDAEITMIASNSTLASLIVEYLDANAYQSELLREQVLQSVALLGCIRWHNHQQNARLNFKGLALGKFFDSNALSIKTEVCIHEIHVRSPNRSIDIEIDVVQSMHTDEIDLLQLVQWT